MSSKILNLSETRFQILKAIDSGIEAKTNNWIQTDLKRNYKELSMGTIRSNTKYLEDQKLIESVSPKLKQFRLTKKGKRLLDQVIALR